MPLSYAGGFKESAGQATELEGYVCDRIAAHREAGVTVLNVTPIAADVPALVGRLKEWIGD
jgi:hypothetical protein